MFRHVPCLAGAIRIEVNACILQHARNFHFPGKPAHISNSKRGTSNSRYDNLDIPPNLKLSIKCKDLIAKANVVQKKEEEIENESPLTLPVVDLFTDQTLNPVELEPSIFNHEIRRDIAHEVIRWQLACRRQGTAKTKSISEVRGSGRKVRKQKGQGMARAGHRRPPHWRGGARAHGPKGNRDWSYKLHKKIRYMGLRVVLSAKLKEKSLHIVSSFELKDSSLLIQPLLEQCGWDRNTLFVDGSELDENFERNVNSIPTLKALWGGAANCYDIVKHERLVLSLNALSFLQEKLK